MNDELVTFIQAHSLKCRHNSLVTTKSQEGTYVIYDQSLYNSRQQTFKWTIMAQYIPKVTETLALLSMLQVNFEIYCGFTITAIPIIYT